VKEAKDKSSQLDGVVSRLGDLVKALGELLETEAMQELGKGLGDFARKAGIDKTVNKVLTLLRGTLADLHRWTGNIVLIQMAAMKLHASMHRFYELRNDFELMGLVTLRDPVTATYAFAAYVDALLGLVEQRTLQGLSDELGKLQATLLEYTIPEVGAAEKKETKPEVRPSP
jgi:hypothetical protein